MERIVVEIAFFLIYFNISGLATTNMLRLTRGNTTPVLASKCYCGVCGAVISPFYQLPVVSYVICKGKCRSCRAKIPTDGLLLELAVMIGMFVITALLSFSFLGVTASFLYYEITRVIVVAVNGKRQRDFAKQYAIAVLAMVPYWLVSLFVAVIHIAVCV